MIAVRSSDFARLGRTNPIAIVDYRSPDDKPRGKLLADGDPTNQIAIRSGTADDEVHVIGHETVRSYFKPIACARAQEFGQHPVDSFSGRKSARAAVCTKGQKSPVHADVASPIKSST
jgi:hypothetical protein